MLHYLRGVRTNEINSAGSGEFRARTGVLGDIVDSSPTWVGPPQCAYTATLGRQPVFRGNRAGAGPERSYLPVPARTEPLR